MSRPLGVVLFLVLSTVLVYAQVYDHGYIHFDDDRYVFANPIVQEGISAQSVVWAFTTTKASNYHPLAWLSHMLDCQIFGVSPGAHHGVSVLIHLLNALLLFGLLNSATASPLKSGFVAALFALHPLHVESVVWISERKDLLSTFFWWLALWGWINYAKAPSAARYMWVTLAFLAGLLSKSMVVTLPFTLLLLDYWPLKRLELRPSSLWERTREKLPLFAISAFFCVLTLMTQQAGRALISIESYPLIVRVSNAAVAYVTYLAKTVWPHRLAAYYPHPVEAQWLLGLGATLLLAAITWGVWRSMRTRPYLAMGWAWYLGTLVPVIGLVQVGSQAMADRYTYVPLLGVFVALAWGVPDLLGRYRRGRTATGVAAALALLASMFVTSAQAARWRDTETLFSYTLRVTGPNAMAHGILGSAYAAQGDADAAIAEYRAALRIKPHLSEAHNNLGTALQRKGKLDEAILHYRAALESRPNHASAHSNLGAALFQQNRLEEAIVHFRRALELQPDSPQVLNNLGIALDAQGHRELGIEHFRAALRQKPDFDKAHYNLALALYEGGDFSESILHFEAVLELDPEHQEARRMLEQARRRSQQ